MDKLIIKGARQHNLKNITLELPKNKLIVFTGISGSGKSSLAFDTIYAEGQRRYVESLSSYARQFLGVMDKPDVDNIEGLSPAISIDQKSTSHNPRSTVGTVTEIYDYLRLLFARIGHPHCPNCGREISRQSPQQIVEQMLKLAKNQLETHGIKQYRFALLSPVVQDRKGEFSGLFDNLAAKGYRQVRVDGKIINVDEDILLIKTNKHSIDVVVDKISIDKKSIKEPIFYANLRSRITDGIEGALSLSDGLVIVADIVEGGFTITDKPKKFSDHIFSEKFACPICNISLSEIEPRSFSFNSPHGACPSCSGIGSILTVDPQLVINPILSISEGGILPFARMFFHDTWFSRVVTTALAQAGIDPRKPLRLLSPAQKDVLLYGTGDRLYRVSGTNRFGDVTSIEEPFHGVVNELKKRYLASESDFLRREIEKYMREEICSSCRGQRLKKESLTITIDGFSIADCTALSISDAFTWIKHLEEMLSCSRTSKHSTEQLFSSAEQAIAAPILREIKARLRFLSAVGLEYLTLDRSATTLAGGEAQRIRLASQIGSGLSGVLYVLDEPSIGLHQRDNIKLIHTLQMLRNLGNTVIVVEHDREMMEEADWLVDIGPGAGEHGGTIIAQGTVGEMKGNPNSLTAQYLNGTRTITRPSLGVKPLHTGGGTARHIGFEKDSNSESSESLTIYGAKQNNLKNIDVSFPLGKFICITGVSGSGKSTLIVETLYQALFNYFNPTSRVKAGAHERIDGLELIDKVILIDQSPIGRTPRSNPATYTGIFTLIRDIFSQLPEARLRGYKPGRFSFNVKGGRCEACEGEGQKKIEMQFLSDIYVTCDVCHGHRYNAETLDVHYHGKSIAHVLDMTVEEARAFFANHPILAEKLATIRDVGLDYIHLGQPAPTLSGGEAQRVKLASELSRRATGKTVYILDEPTTGLHFADLEKLLQVLHRLTGLGNTVLVIEHNLDIIKNADWIIDLGPEGGDAGGRVIASGIPQQVARVKSSYTGQFLKKILE
ncbi:excinuclease ABC subunit UvrA [Candidatus Gottesmanbacteria bacterium]|nr:excinuclease ABC subunit UvrA [Candidatus Gottesmanbacteria bacterium]